MPRIICAIMIYAWIETNQNSLQLSTTKTDILINCLEVNLPFFLPGSDGEVMMNCIKGNTFL